MGSTMERKRIEADEVINAKNKNRGRVKKVMDVTKNNNKRVKRGLLGEVIAEVK